ncbi:hypothetical protein [Endothiovibrio diazotrophicus]
MLINGLMAMRRVVKEYEPLQARLVELYGRPAKYWIGIKKPQKSSDYPSFVFAILEEKRVPSERKRVQRIGIAWFLQQPGVDDDGEVHQGMLDLSEIGELVVAAIRADLSLGGIAQVDADLETLTDVSISHPNYHGETVIKLKIKEVPHG